jgi:hypothetical protein
MSIANRGSIIFLRSYSERSGNGLCLVPSWACKIYACKFGTVASLRYGGGPEQLHMRYKNGSPDRAT